VVEVIWPDSQKQKFTDLQPDRFYQLAEGSNRVEFEAFKSAGPI
jgi:hypothetical protein